MGRERQNDLPSPIPGVMAADRGDGTGADPMRCARCDQPVVRQTVGWSGEEILVFGWCLECVEDAGCRLVDEDPPHRSGHQRDREQGEPRGTDLVPPAWTQATVSPALTVSRLPAVGRIAYAMLLVGGGFLSGGFYHALTPRPALEPATGPSPFGNGSPAFLFVGGLALITVGLMLWKATRPQRPSRSPRASRFDFDRPNALTRKA